AARHAAAPCHGRPARRRAAGDHRRSLRYRRRHPARALQSCGRSAGAARFAQAPDRRRTAGRRVRAGAELAAGFLPGAHAQAGGVMNPELLRNLWLHFSPQRIIAAPLILGAAFALAALATDSWYVVGWAGRI